eukprot:1136606-Pelagomonas_calceolata.AAC.4
MAKLAMLVIKRSWLDKARNQWFIHGGSRQDGNELEEREQSWMLMAVSLSSMTLDRYLYRRKPPVKIL